MALEVLYGNSVDALARELADRVGAFAADDPLASPLVVVPGRALSAIVERRIAERLGVAMSVRRVGARGLWSRVADSAGLTVLDARRLAAEIVARAATSPFLAEVREYVAQAPAEAREPRAIEAAVSLAALILEDDRERPALVDAWLSGASPEGTPKWQGALFAELFDRDGAAREGDGVLPSRAAACALGRGGALPERVHIFCPAPPSPGDLDNLRRLVAGATVTAYVTSPCRGFWEDFSPDDPRLLVALGRAGRAAVRAWNALGEHASDDVHTARPATTVLSTMQALVLDRARAEAPPPAPDASLTFHDCPNPTREAEIAKSLVLDAMAGPSALQPQLRPDEVAIVVPERLTEEYFARLARALASPPALPFTIVGRRLVETSPAAAAARALLALPGGEITRDSVLRALCHDAVRTRPHGVTAGGMRSLARRLGVLWGADASDLEGTHVDRDIYHWDQALSRLSLGFFADARPDVIDHGRGPWLGFVVTDEDADDAAALVDGARRLLSDASKLARASLPLRDWSAALAAYLDTYLVEEDRDAGRAAALDACGALAALDVDGRAVSYAAASRWLTDALMELEDPGGEPLFEGAVVGSLSALAAAPARMVVIVGALESALPRTDARHPLDVGTTPRTRPLSRADRDRYNVLTRVTDAERVAVTWVGRDPASGAPSVPSPVVADLRAAVDELGEPSLAGALTRAHPTNRAEDAGAALRARAAIVEANMTTVARAIHGAGGPPRDLDEVFDKVTPTDRAKLERLLSVPRPPAGGPAARRVSLGLLRRFVEWPVSAAAEWLTQVEDQDDPEEPLDGDALTRAIVLRPAMLRAEGDPSRARAFRDQAYLRRELAGVAPSGFYGAREREVEDEIIDAWAAAGGLSGLIEVAFGAARPLGERVRRRACARVGVWEVNGVTPAMTPDLSRSVALCMSKKPSLRHALPAAISLAVLASEGEPLPGSHTVAALGTEGSSTFRVRTPERDEATAWLAALLEDLTRGPPPYTVTFSAVATWAQHGRKQEKGRARGHGQPPSAKSLADVVEEELSRPMSPSVGPLARAELALPDERDAALLLQTRYEFLLSRLEQLDER